MAKSSISKVKFLAFKGFQSAVRSNTFNAVNRIRWYSSNSNKYSLHPYWISGFTDAEGSFIIKTYEAKNRKYGWRIEAVFQISLHKRDEILLNRIKEYFGVGSFSVDRNYIAYVVRSLKDLNQIIIPFFEKYNLITQKKSDFELFKQIVFIKAKNRSLCLEEFKEILSLKVNLNKGFSSTAQKLMKAYPDVLPVPRPKVKLQEIPHPQWLTGFIDGEGCFIINIQEWISSVNGNVKWKVWLTMFITQHSRDISIMENIVKYLDCGQVLIRSNQPAVDYKVGRLDNIITKVIPFLQKYPLQSVKEMNLKNWVEASLLILNKEHLTEGGIEKIKIIKNSMNKNKVY